MRMYEERYVPADAGPAELAKPVAEESKDLIEVALAISQLKEFFGMNQPTVITISYHHQCVCMTMIDFFPPK